MELLNLSFAILVFKITLFILPLVFGIFLICSSQQTKRNMRNRICDQLFGVNNAIPLYKFTRFLYTIGGLIILLGLTAGWYLVLRNYV